jgi:hypothetical protein
MNSDQFLDEPLTDKALFRMLRESFSDDASCWEAVKEAQKAYKDLRRQVVRFEMEEERAERNLYTDAAAA